MISGVRVALVICHCLHSLVGQRASWPSRLQTECLRLGFAVFCLVKPCQPPAIFSKKLSQENEMKRIGLGATFAHIQAKLNQENFLRMVRWVRWHCPPDTGFAIQTWKVWGRAPYLSITEAPHNTKFQEWMGKKHFCFFQTAETGKRTPNSSVKGSSANHYPKAPAQVVPDLACDWSRWPSVLRSSGYIGTWIIGWHKYIDHLVT